VTDPDAAAGVLAGGAAEVSRSFARLAQTAAPDLLENQPNGSRKIGSSGGSKPRLITFPIAVLFSPSRQGCIRVEVVVA
jgi:hypothetical protein